MARGAGVPGTAEVSVLACTTSTRLAMSAAQVLQRVTAALEESGIPYMLTGSFASAHYGVLRSTMDIDIVIAATAEQLRSFSECFPSTEYYLPLESAFEACHRQSMFNLIDLTTGWKIDLIFRKSRPFSLEEFGRREQVSVEGVPLFVASAEDVILAKLEWSKLSQSKRQIEDVAAILKVRWALLDQSYLQKWISDLNLQPQWRDVTNAAGVSKQE